MFALCLFLGEKQNEWIQHFDFSIVVVESGVWIRMQQ